MKIIILGPPGSGKGTISEKLEREFKWKHISAGELLREEVKKGTTIGKDIKKIMEKGSLVPDQLVAEIVKLEISNHKNYLLDGFPRSLGQAEHMEDIPVDAVIYLHVPQSIVVERLAGRRICEQGIHGYHLQYLPPKKAGICDKDGTRLIHRPDDKPAAIKQRFKVFHKRSQPAVEYFRKKKMLLEVEASGSPNEVYKKVKKALKLIKQKFKK